MLGLFCLGLFGYAMFSGRPLSLHEARLPELSREMMRDGYWLIPHSGGRPWLERPPLPHWFTISISMLLRQRCDSVWVVRMPAVLAGGATVLLTAWVAARLFGRSIGILAGLVLATAFEFYVYACRGEDDIFLAALVAAAVALFVYTEFPATQAGADLLSFAGRRPWPVLAFFAVLGLTSLAKGPLLGAAVVIPAIAAFLLLAGELSRVRRYVWLWGGILFLALTAIWPVAVYLRFGNEALDYWIYDYARITIEDHPFWWYLRELPWCLAPWTPAALIGMWSTFAQARRSPSSPERFLWCWAIVPVLVLSLSHRKHHHYLVPSLAPWAILSALGLRQAASFMLRAPGWPRRPGLALLAVGLPAAAAIALFHSKIPGPLPMTILVSVAGLACVAAILWGLSLQSGRIVIGAFVTVLVLLYSWGQSFIPDQTTQDTIFLRKVDATVPRGDVVFVNGDLHGEMDFFRICFYLGDHARLLHNLTFLRDERIKAPEAYVITRAKDRPLLDELGTTRIVLQSEKTRRERVPADRFTLFLLRFDPALRRYPPPARVSAAQALGRVPGPNLGPPL